MVSQAIRCVVQWVTTMVTAMDPLKGHMENILNGVLQIAVSN